MSEGSLVHTTRDGTQEEILMVDWRKRFDQPPPPVNWAKSESKRCKSICSDVGLSKQFGSLRCEKEIGHDDMDEDKQVHASISSGVYIGWGPVMRIDYK
jgi:hypothetical protein